MILGEGVAYKITVQRRKKWEVCVALLGTKKNQ